MSVPKKHHYLPQFFLDRWCVDGRLMEFRRPHENLVSKRKSPAATGYETDLYANEAKLDPLERQALEMVFMQKVDDGAAAALTYLEEKGRKPTDPRLRDAWSRFLMSLLHRSPERVRHLSAKVKAYEENKLIPELEAQYSTMRGENDPLTYEEFRTLYGDMTAELRTMLLRMIIDSKTIGNTLNAMHWQVHRTWKSAPFRFHHGGPTDFHQQRSRAPARFCAAGYFADSTIRRSARHERRQSIHFTAPECTRASGQRCMHNPVSPRNHCQGQSSTSLHRSALLSQRTANQAGWVGGLGLSTG